MIEEHPESLNLKDAKGARGSPNIAKLLKRLRIPTARQ